MKEIIYEDDLSFLLFLHRNRPYCHDLDFKRFIYRGFSVDILLNNRRFACVSDVDYFIDCFYSFDSFEMPDTSSGILSDGDVPF